MTILFVSSGLHAAQQGGGGSYTRSVLRRLSLAFPLATITEVALSPSGLSSALPRSARQALAIAISIAGGPPAKTLFAVGVRATQKLRKVIGDVGPDLVVVNSTELAGLAPAIPPGTGSAIIAHNDEPELLRAQASREAASNPYMARVLAHEAEKMAKVEAIRLPQLGKIIAISGHDAAHFSEAAPGAQVLTLPPSFPGPADPGPRPKASRPLEVGFLARFSWWPNREALLWFMHQVLDHLPEGRIHLNVFGDGSKGLVSRQSPRATAYGFVPNLSEVWRRCHMMICPTQSGSGVNIKLGESLFNGVPTIATPMAIRGLQPLEGAGLVVLETARDWRAFFSGTDAEVLATTPVCGQLRRRFHDDSDTPALRAFLNQAGEAQT